MTQDTIMARQGDTLDGLLWRDRGLGASALPSVLDVNPGLAALGAVLPAGTPVAIPAAAPAAANRPLIQLWD